MPRKSGFTEPPWVMGSPKEVMDWIEASNPSKKNHKDKSKKENKFLRNLHIKFDFNVKKTEIEPDNFISKILGKKIILEDIELLPTAEFILRGLAKAKFKNTAKIVIDGKILYDHPESTTDLRETIEEIGEEFSNEISKGKQLEMTAILKDVEKSTAIIKIRKIHSKKEHSIDIQIKGKIREELYHTFLNYLKEKISFKDKE